eukprot:scaffold3479_cov21-Tisochrysis_lutea.AAC.1
MPATAEMLSVGTLQPCIPSMHSVYALSLSPQMRLVVDCYSAHHHRHMARIHKTKLYSDLPLWVRVCLCARALLSVRVVPGFADAVRKYVLHVIGITFQRTSKAVLADALNLDSKAMDALQKDMDVSMDAAPLSLHNMP